MNLVKLRTDSRSIIDLSNPRGINVYKNNLRAQIEYVNSVKQASSLIMNNPVLVEDDSLYYKWSPVVSSPEIRLYKIREFALMRSPLYRNKICKKAKLRFMCPF